MLLAGAALLLLAALSHPGDAAAAAKKSKILSPKSGSVLPARPHVIRVKTGRNPKRFRAQLNGRPIAKHFSNPSKRGVSKLRASRTHGLRHGGNVIHVKLRRRHGSNSNSTTRFRIRRNAPLAATGRARKVEAGHAIHLNGHRSISHLPPNRDDLDHRWALLKHRGAAASGVSIEHPNSEQPRLVTEEPGTYRVRLTVTAENGVEGTDKLKINSVNPPLVSVDTMTEASGGAPGIKVGDDPYPADAGTAANPAWYQVVVLDRKKLTGSSKTYLCNSGGGGVCNDSQLRQDLAGLDSDKLVIVASHSGNSGWTQSAGSAPFASIGARDFPNGVGSFSAIGVPKDSPGEATWHLDSLGGNRGRITGTLIKDNIGNYTYLSPRVDFDTQVPGSTAAQNVIQVNGRDFTEQLSLDSNQNGIGGFHVVVLDRMHLEQDAQSHWFPTGLQNFDSGEPGRLDQMTATLRDANNADKIVIIASRGNPATQGGRDDQQENVNHAVQRLVDQIEALGGTRTTAFRSLSPNVTKSGASYTLIGTSKAGAGKGLEVQGTATTPPRGLNSVALRGNFSHSNDFGFEVADSSPSRLATGTPPNMAGEKLNETLVQEPMAWRGESNPRQQAAVAWIGLKAFGQGIDPRTYYWSSGKPDSYWTAKPADVDAVPMAPPNPDPGFTEAELNTAKANIKQEIGLLIQARGFTTELATPFTTGLNQYADINKISAEVDKNVQGKDRNEAEAIAYAIFDGAREIATVIPEIGEGIGVINQVFDTALEISRITSENNGAADDPYEVTVADFGSRLVNRVKQASDTLTKEMTNAVVADWGKLQTVGSCHADRQADCPDDVRLWDFGDTAQTNATTALRYGTAKEAYGVAVPARWTLFQLADSCAGSKDYTCWETGFQGNGFSAGVGAFNAPVCPFLENHASTQLIRPLYRDIPRYRNDAGFQGFDQHPTDVWQVFALGHIDGGGVVGNVYTSELPGDTLTRLFAPVDAGGVYEKGGLGADPEQFFLSNMQPKLMAESGKGQPYPYKDSKPQWRGKNTDCVRW